MNYMTRRSIRKFKDQKVEKEKVDELLRVALVAPTGRNTQCTKFIVVDDKNTIEYLSNVRQTGSQFLKNAPLVIAVIGDKTKSTTVVSDCSIAAFAIQMRAHEIGLGSCWVHMQDRKSADGEDSEKLVKGKLNIPEEYMVMCLIGLGHPDETKPAHELKDEDYKRVCYNTYKED